MDILRKQRNEQLLETGEEAKCLDETVIEPDSIVKGKRRRCSANGIAS
jgi:hypothetical protein